MENKRISYDLEIDKLQVGSRIKEIRLLNNLTLEEFGERLGGVSKGGVYHWESGKNLPNRSRLEKIAELGSITVNELLYGNVEGCEYCRNEEYLADMDKFHPLDAGIYGNVLSLMWEENSYGMEINFCPMCGSEVK